MKTHHFYYLTLAFIILIGGSIAWLFISEVIVLKDDIEREYEQTSAKNVSTDTTATALISDTITTIKVRGIDISKFQGTVDWSTLNKKIIFIFCKATEGRTLIDTEFSFNWMNIKKYGRIRGAYHFYITTDDPVTQANFFWNTVGTYSENDLPLVLDIERASLRGTTNKTNLQNDLLIFLKTLENLSGKMPIIYSNTNFANEYLNNSALAVYPLWVAEYTSRDAPSVPTAWASHGWQFWQKADTYDLNSINGEVDFDLYRGDFNDLLNFVKTGATVE